MARDARGDRSGLPAWVEPMLAKPDSGYTMCLGAASAKDRLDVVCRDAMNAGSIPGPRYLANGPEIAVTGGALIKSITKFADGPEGMRKAVRELIDLGVDQIKLSMTGEEITGTQRAEDTYFSDDEVAPPSPKPTIGASESARTPAAPKA
jgi:imidazolonepropionase-like amidohydrolase